MIPYSKQSISQEDIEAVAKVLRSPMIQTGIHVQEFESRLAAHADAYGAVAFSSGTAALYALYKTQGIGPKRGIVTSPLTFIATANAAKALGAKVRFQDIDIETGQPVLTPTRREIAVPVDFMGLRMAHDIPFSIRDSCHSVGVKVSDSNDLASVYSFHPVKTITTGEGGAVIIHKHNNSLLQDLRAIRSHGIQKTKDWHYENSFRGAQEFGLNFRMTDMQAALGLSQLKRIDEFIQKRQAIAKYYDESFEAWAERLGGEVTTPDRWSAHLYCLIFKSPEMRKFVYKWCLYHGVGVQVHYTPLYRFPLYSKGHNVLEFPTTEYLADRILSIPIYPDLTTEEMHKVSSTIKEAITAWG